MIRDLYLFALVHGEVQLRLVQDLPPQDLISDITGSPPERKVI